MIFGIFEDWAQFLEVVGVWLAALATFAATLVALYVAQKANAQSVEVFARPMLEVTPGIVGSQNPVFFITATNCGLRPVTITNLAIRCRFPRYDAVLMAGLPGSAPLPVTLRDGESANWRFPENATNGGNWYRGIAEHFSQYGAFKRWCAVKGIRFFVITSLGQNFFAPRSDKFQQKLAEQMREVQKA